MLRIETEKVVVQGEKKRRILGYSGLMRPEELPAQYTSGYPYVEALNYGDGLYVGGKHPDCGNCYGWRVEIGALYEEKIFQEYMELICEAGQRLHECRLVEKKLKEEWKGEETFVI